MIAANAIDKFTSSRAMLESRGYIDHLDISHYSKEKKPNLTLLSSTAAIDRSIAAKMLGYHLGQRSTMEALLLQLDKEKALYTRLEICNTMRQGNATCAKLMISYLGKIGNNQHLALPKRISNKSSFPLPRDIIARTLGRMDKRMIRILIHALPATSLAQRRELIDAIGYLCSHQEVDRERVFQSLYTLQQTNDDPIITWKLMYVYRLLKPCSILALESIPKTMGIIYEEAQKSLYDKKVEC